jgi:acyl carrier protein
MSLERIFAEVFSISEKMVNDSLFLREISSWGSMSHMMLIARVEEAISVKATGDEIADFWTVRDIYEVLSRRAAKCAGNGQAFVVPDTKPFRRNSQQFCARRNSPTHEARAS